MNGAVDDELIAASPDQVRGAGAATTKRPAEPATPAEIELFADNMPPRLRAAVWIAAWCALHRDPSGILGQRLPGVRRGWSAVPGCAADDADVTYIDLPHRPQADVVQTRRSGRTHRVGCRAGRRRLTPQ